MNFLWCGRFFCGGRALFYTAEKPEKWLKQRKKQVEKGSGQSGIASRIE
jgi:hypothetical protein